MTRIAGCVVWLAVFSLGTATRVRGEPINITAGSMVVTLQSGAPIVLQGSRGFSLEGFADATEGSINVREGCVPCEPGSTLDVGTELVSIALFGTATFEGVRYTLGQGIDTPIRRALRITGSAALPAVADRPVIVRAPFTVSGFFSPPDAVGADIKGSGIVTVHLSLLEPGDPAEPRLWMLEKALYDFGTEPAPVPEPASVILLGLGVGAAAVRGRRQRWYR